MISFQPNLETETYQTILYLIIPIMVGIMGAINLLKTLQREYGEFQ